MIPVAIISEPLFQSNPFGFVAATKRKIQNGSSYNRFFKPATRKKTLISADATVYDTLSLMERIILDTREQTKAFTQYLESQSKSDEDFYRKLFEFLYTHIQYEQDTHGIEQLREPVRTWKDRKADCDCFSIFVSSVLHNYKGGVPHSLRIIRMKGQPSFHHVYVIVPKSGGITIDSPKSQYYVIDPVLDQFNQEADFIVEVFDKALNGSALGWINVSKINQMVKKVVDSQPERIKALVNQIKIEIEDYNTALSLSYGNPSGDFNPGKIDMASYFYKDGSNFGKPIEYVPAKNSEMTYWSSNVMNNLGAGSVLPDLGFATVLFKYYFPTLDLATLNLSYTRDIWPFIRDAYVRDLQTAGTTWSAKAVRQDPNENNKKNPGKDDTVDPKDDPNKNKNEKPAGTNGMLFGLGIAAGVVLLANGLKPNSQAS